jgi:hypothetical protein
MLLQLRLAAAAPLLLLLVMLLGEYQKQLQSCRGVEESLKGLLRDRFELPMPSTPCSGGEDASSRLASSLACNRTHVKKAYIRSMKSIPVQGSRHICAHLE